MRKEKDLLKDSQPQSFGLIRVIFLLLSALLILESPVNYGHFPLGLFLAIAAEKKMCFSGKNVKFSINVLLLIKIYISLLFLTASMSKSYFENAHPR